jgi:SAM-dependent methyltransferase
MKSNPLSSPETDPTPIFELFRGAYATELLTAAIAHFGLFARLAASPLLPDDLRATLGLAERPAIILLTALRAMGLLSLSDGKLHLTPLAREHLVAGGEFDVGNYIGLAAQSPGVLAMVERLRTNRPANFDTAAGAAFIYRDGLASAMEQSESARHFTLALAGRARNVAPALAERIDLASARRVLDIGGGTGIYAIAMLRRAPHLRALVLDRPEVLRVAAEMAERFEAADRLELVPGDMFRDPLPEDCDLHLLSNVLHDWDVPECRELIARSAAALGRGGRLLIHDVFLNDDLDGPLPIALYSAALFTLTEGRAYSAAEYRCWLHEAGFETRPVVPTLVHCGVLEARKK